MIEMFKWFINVTKGVIYIKNYEHVIKGLESDL